MSALAHEGSTNKHGIKSLPLYLVERGIMLGEDGLSPEEWMELIKGYEVERLQRLIAPAGEVISLNVKIAPVVDVEQSTENAA